jgi:hypothetical protein
VFEVFQSLAVRVVLAFVQFTLFERVRDPYRCSAWIMETHPLIAIRDLAASQRRGI